MKPEAKIYSRDEIPDSAYQELENLSREIFKAILPLISNSHPVISTNALSNTHALILCQLVHGFLEKDKHTSHIDSAANVFRELCIDHMKTLNQNPNPPNG